MSFKTFPSLSRHKGLEKVHKTFARPKTDKFRPSCFVRVITFCGITVSPSKSWNKCFKRLKYIYRAAKRLLLQHLELMPFLNAMLNQKEALLMLFKPNLQNITECTTNAAITAFHIQVTACPLIQLLLLNLSSIQGISLIATRSTNRVHQTLRPSPKWTCLQVEEQRGRRPLRFEKEHKTLTKGQEPL